MRGIIVDIVGEIEFHGIVLDVWDDWDEPLFLAKDVSWILYGYPHTANLLRIVSPEDTLLCNIHTIGHNRPKRFITQTGLYEALSRSTLPQSQLWLKVIHRNIIAEQRKQGIRLDRQFKEWQEQGSMRNEWFYDSNKDIWIRDVGMDEYGDVVIETYDANFNRLDEDEDDY